MTTVAPRYSLEAVARVLEDIPEPAVIDLVSIAAHVYAADKSHRRGRGWKREIIVPVAVSSRELWRAVEPNLARALHALTDDVWELEFTEGRTALAEEQQARLFVAREQPLEAIALFSGGLDSYAGAARWLQEHPSERLGLLSLCSSTVVTKVQRDLVTRLAKEYPNRVKPLPIPLNLVKAPDVERSQRTRGFLYTAVASAAAHWSEARNVLIFENGYGSLNPRLVDHQHGAQATKSTHPDVLHQFEQAYRLVGLDVRIRLPYGDCTKAELVSALPSHLRDAIRLTVSCDGFPLRTKVAKQCGKCGSCILRQQSLKAAGLDAFDRNDYKERCLDSLIPPAHLLLMAFQAWQLSRIVGLENYAEAVRRWPEIGTGGTGGIGEVSFDAIHRVALLRRYGAEWAQIVADDPALGLRLGWSGAS